MTIHTNVGGVWKDVDAPEVKIGSNWKAVDTVEINVGGVWKEVFSSGPGLVVTVAPTKTVWNWAVGALCKSHVQIHTDGGLYASNNQGFFVTGEYEHWLTSGSSSDAYIDKTVISGTLNSVLWSGRLALSVSPILGVLRGGGSSGTTTCVVDLEWYDVPVGGTPLDVQRLTLQAQVF